MRKSRRAFSLIEAAIVLVIAGIVFGVIWLSANAVYYDNKVNTAQLQKEQILRGLRSLYAAVPTVAPPANNFDLSRYRQAGVLPLEMWRNPAAVVGAADFGVADHALLPNLFGAGSVGANYALPAAGQPFALIIIFQGLEPQACADLVVRDSARQGARSNLLSLVINANAPNVNLPLATADAVTQCFSANPATLTWTYRGR
jgi:type II secretory pathway pseudopilin PulG